MTNEKYYVISCFDGNLNVREFTKENLIEDYNEETMESIPFIEEAKELSFDNWGERVLVIKGEVITDRESI